MSRSRRIYSSQWAYTSAVLEFKDRFEINFDKDRSSWMLELFYREPKRQIDMDTLHGTRIKSIIPSDSLSRSLGLFSFLDLYHIYILEEPKRFEELYETLKKNRIICEHIMLPELTVEQDIRLLQLVKPVSAGTSIDNGSTRYEGLFHTKTLVGFTFIFTL